MTAPHTFTLRQIQYAVAVADALSFRRAAERCHVSQPSLSAQIAALEAALGIRLFDRSRRRVLATPAGLAFLERARQLLLEADELAGVARRAGDPLTGALRLGVIPTIAPYLLPFATPRIRREFPGLTIAWVEEKTAAVVGRLESGALDGALVALEADLGDVEHEAIAEDPFLLVAPVGHTLVARTSPAASGDLRGADVLLLDDGHCLRDQALEVCSSARARETEFRATSLPTLVQMVAQGAGLTLLPAIAVEAETRRTGLAARAFRPPAPRRTIALIWRRRSAIGAALRRLALPLRKAYTAATIRGRSARRRPPASSPSRRSSSPPRSGQGGRR